MTNLNGLVITGMRNFTFKEASSLSVHPYNGIVLVCKNGDETIFISSFSQSRRDGKFKPASFFMVDKNSSAPIHFANLNIINSISHSIVTDGKESPAVRWLDKKSDSSEGDAIGKKIIDYGKYSLSFFENYYFQYFNRFNKPSVSFCSSISLINLSSNMDLIACAEKGSVIENSRFYVLSKDDGFITSLDDVFDKTSIHFHLI